MRAYYAMIENLDDNVGRLLDELQARGIRDETAVVFISDHGEMMGSHGLMAKQHPSEESVGVPFIVSYPEGGIDGGQTIAEPTCTEDWYPTILGLAGIDIPEKPGEDLTHSCKATDRRSNGRASCWSSSARSGRTCPPTTRRGGGSARSATSTR